MSTFTKISYTITPACQRAEIAAGRDGSQYQTVVVDLVPLIGDETHIQPVPDGALRYCPTGSRYSSLANTLPTPQDQILDQDTAIAAIRADIARIEAEQATAAAEEQAAIDRWLALPDGPEIDGGKISREYSRGIIRYRYNFPRGVERTDPRIADECRRLQDICASLNREAEAEVERREAAEAATDARKLAQLADAVSRLGSEVQRDKWAAGLMARREAIDLLWNDVFAPLGDRALDTEEWHIPKIEAEEYEAAPEREEGEKLTLSDEEFEAAQAAIALIPGCTAEYVHQYYSDGREGGHMYARLSVVRGEYTLRADVELS
jgi:hypothetical protein